tara:strand:+ start:1025 stop:1795 length:771 start_codon:yes stop_codon:yes gene_type:complete
MKLNSYHIGSADAPALIIIHGLFGSASNFRSLAKIYSEDFSVTCLDLRNHGASPHDNDVSFDAMAADVVEFMDDHGIPRAHIMGHSLGGKVAMQLALTHPDRIDKLIIGDIAPITYPHHHDRIFEGLQAVRAARLTSRKEAEAILAEYVQIPQVRLFLMTNMVRGADQVFDWRINVDGLQQNYAELAKAPTGTPFTGKSCFIRGEMSDYVKETTYDVIKQIFPQAEIVTLKGAGHWLHAEKPQEYVRLTLDFLKKD